MWRRLFEAWLTASIAALYWLWSRTWRIERIRYPRSHGEKPRLVWAHWHGDELLLASTEMFRGMAVMTSRSRDGERMGRILGRFGYRVVRGSSSRGGAGGLKGLIDRVRHDGCEASLAVDGPRGPLYRVKPGIVKLAQETGALIVPGAAAARRRLVFTGAWNQGFLPLPFTRGVVIYGDPLAVPATATAEELEEYRRELERRLTQLKVQA